MDQPVTGQCFCGAIQFRFEQPPLTTRACWCRDCQYLSAGNASVNVIFRTDSFGFTGKTAEYVSTAESGNVMRRSFCPSCGTPLFSQGSHRPDVMVVRAGALNDREIARPAGFIWTASAPSWACIDSGLSNSERQPPALPSAAP